jgi:hypothetical protein
VHALAEAGIDCAVDPQLAEGDPFWRESVAESLARCELMVCLVSGHALASPWVEQEQRAFPGRKLWVLVDRGHPHAGPTFKTETLVPLDQAVAAIRHALPSDAPASRPVTTPFGATVEAERVARITQAESALAAFRIELSRIPRPRADFACDVAHVGHGLLTLRRINGTTPAMWMGVTPVTNAQYRAFLEVSDYPEPPTWTRAAFRVDDSPVTGINWYEAFAFACWVGGTLPTESDWVSAARGAEASRTYATSTGELTSDVACFGRLFGAAAPVSATDFPPNAEGFYGMSGNTWDWSSTPWGIHRVILGGGSMDDARFCAIQSRYRNAPMDRDCSVGFRVKFDAQPS